MSKPGPNQGWRYEGDYSWKARRRYREYVKRVGPEPLLCSIDLDRSVEYERIFEEQRKRVYKCGTCGWRDELWVPADWLEGHPRPSKWCPNKRCWARREEMELPEEPKADPDLADVMGAVLPDENCKDCKGTGIYDYKLLHGHEGQEPCGCTWDPSQYSTARLANKFIKQAKELEEAKRLLRERLSFFRSKNAREALEEWKQHTRIFLELDPWEEP